MGEERDGQGKLFDDEPVRTDIRQLGSSVSVVGDISDRVVSKQTKIGQLPLGDYRVIIGNSKKVLHTVGEVPRDDIHHSASVYPVPEGFKVYVQRFK